MNPTVLFVVILLLSIGGFFLGRRKALLVGKRGQGVRNMHSKPVYYGALTGLWCGLPALIIMGIWLAVGPNVVMDLVINGLPSEMRNLPEDQLNLVVNNIHNLVSDNIVAGEKTPALVAAAAQYHRFTGIGHGALAVVALAIAVAAILLVERSITPRLRARNQVERLIQWLLIACSTIAIFTTLGIVLSVLFEAIRFFRIIPISDFLFGLDWSPQMAIREDQVGSSGAFGAIPVFLGTGLISAIAMVVAVPIGLMSAIYLSEYAGKRFRAFAKPALEILAGVPTVVYGFFAALTVAPIIRGFGDSVGLDVSSESALAAGLVMGVMIIPFVSSLSDDVINAVPQSLRDGAYGLGATRSETIKQVIIPAALPGIVGGVLLAVSRAIGETMIVVMAAGLAANLTANPFQAVTTVTVQIVTLLVGDQEFDSPKTLAAFALGLVLFLMTLVLNVIALYVVRKYREQYE